MATLDIKACVESIETARAQQEQLEMVTKATADHIANNIYMRLPFALAVGGSDSRGLLRVGSNKVPDSSSLVDVVKQVLFDDTGAQWIYEGGNIWAVFRVELEAGILAKSASLSLAQTEGGA